MAHYAGPWPLEEGPASRRRGGTPRGTQNAHIKRHREKRGQYAWCSAGLRRYHGNPICALHSVRVRSHSLPYERQYHEAIPCIGAPMTTTRKQSLSPLDPSVQGPLAQRIDSLAPRGRSVGDRSRTRRQRRSSGVPSPDTVVLRPPLNAGILSSKTLSVQYSTIFYRLAHPSPHPLPTLHWKPRSPPGACALRPPSDGGGSRTL